MSQAPNYSPITSFAQDESNQASGRSTVRTAAVDVELANIAASINALNTNLQLLQRDDGKVRDLLLEPYMLGEAVRAMLTTAGVTLRGAWAANTQYALKDLVQRNGVALICQTPHNSGPSFNQGFWLSISGDGQAQFYAEQAGVSATAAATSATTAATSATTATTAATNAGNSATAAAASQLAAQNSANSIAGLAPVNLNAFMLDLLANVNAAGVRGDIDAASATDLASVANGKGDALVAVKQPFTGSVARTQHDKNAESLSLLDFGADPTGATDSALAIEAWWSAGYANNIPLYAPPGTYLTSTGHTFTYSASKKTSIRGAGCGATTFRKTGANSGAVFKFTISSGSYLEMNLPLADFEVEAPGLSAVNGLEFDAAALVSLTRVRGKNCAIGLKAYGLLVSVLEDVDFSGNQHGMQFRRGTAGSQPYANLVVIKGRSRCNGNTGWGLDYDQGSGLIIKGFLDCESNGTAADTGTGGVLIRDTVDDEFGTGVIDIDGLWLESNKGHSFIMQGAANAHLRMNNVTVLAQESTRAITIGAIRSATFSLVNAPSANAELVCQAEQQHYLGGVQVYTLTTTGATLLTGQVKTNSSMGNTWEATAARVGALEVSTSLQGTVDGAVNLGSGSRRFNTVYATTGTINTSDEREKEQFRAQLAAEKRVALAIKGSLKAFKFRDAVSEKGGAARWHFGTGAQTVAAAFQAEGLDPGAYGLFCYDEWPATDDQPAGHRYGIRYDELAMFILAAI